MKIRWNKFLFFLLTLAAAACVEPYEPAILAEDHSYLVVEGFLNSGNEPSVIKLSRTVRLDEVPDAEKEVSATVSVESEKGSNYLFQPGQEGTYILEPLDLDTDDRYRLRIKTSNGKEYLSEFTEVKQTPPIDSISWKYGEEGVRIFVNTHDPQNNSWYYRWEFEEAWEFNVAYHSYVKFEGGEMLDRAEPTPVNCFRNSSSGSIILGSSAKLQQDIISERLLTIIPRASRKISSKYSILVKQYAMTKEAFQYYQQMEKNSEQRGSFFDPQPMEVNGNLQNINAPDEPVIGFFSVGSVEEKRIFISNREVIRPLWGWRMDCSTIEVSPEDYFSHLGGSYEPLYVDMRGYAIAAPASCVDCSKNGSTIRPLFWE